MVSTGALTSAIAREPQCEDRRVGELQTLRGQDDTIRSELSSELTRMRELTDSIKREAAEAGQRRGFRRSLLGGKKAAAVEVRCALREDPGDSGVLIISLDAEGLDADDEPEFLQAPISKSSEQEEIFRHAIVIDLEHAGEFDARLLSGINLSRLIVGDAAEDRAVSRDAQRTLINRRHPLIKRGIAA